MSKLTFRQFKNARNGYVLGNKVRVALKWKERLVGLLGTKSLEVDSGIWLMPCKGIHTIGMRYPIDVVFMDKTNKVQKIASNVLPFRMCSAKGETFSVLEFPVGTIERCDVRIGDDLVNNKDIY